MKKNSSKGTEAEADFAADLYRDRVALNGKAQQLLATGLRELTICLSSSELARAKQKGAQIKRNSPRSVLSRC